MGHRVSAYLSDELFGAWKASGLPLGEAVRRGLSQPAIPPQALRPGDRIRVTASGVIPSSHATLCDHPKSARDAKNPARCRCGAVNLPAPGRKP